MNIEFSTTNRREAWTRIKRALPYVTPEQAEPLLALVGSQVRIGDPMMYGGQAPVFPMPGADTEQIRQACLTLQGTQITKETP